MYSSDITHTLYIYIHRALKKSLREAVAWGAACSTKQELQSSIMAVLASCEPGSASMQYNRQWHEKAGDTGRQGFAQQPQLRRACTETEREADRIESNMHACTQMLLVLLEGTGEGESRREKGMHGR